MTRLVRRQPPPDAGDPLPADLHPLLRRLYLQRGLTRAEDCVLSLKHLAAPTLRGLEAAVALLDEAITAQRRVVIAGDYDCDGATGVTVAVRGLRMLGAQRVDYVVPDRFRMGYGLSPALVDEAAARGAQLIVTVDNGIASHAGVDRARALGIPVLVTDHHLPGPQLPAAAAIVNPNQPGCAFPSRHLAGVGVMFYLLIALRAHRRGRGEADAPLAELLDLVALGTVADVVRLDANNRRLVAAGLERMRAGRCQPGVAALLEVAGRAPATLTAQDLGFALGPRINAAGRLTDIRTGIECLLTDDPDRALALAKELDAINRERRLIEADMRDTAFTLTADADAAAAALCVFQPDWHEGVVGLVAARLKEAHHRPAIAAARSQMQGLLKASGRTIEGLHLRDALAAVDAAEPGLIERFGGHAMAAGLSLREEHWLRFAAAFEAECRSRLSPAQLERSVESDGELPPEWLTLDTARVLETAGPWGQGFPEPCFDGVFTVRELRAMGANGEHFRYRLDSPGSGERFTAVHFNAGGSALAPGQRRHLVYRLAVNRWQDTVSLQLQVEHVLD